MRDWRLIPLLLLLAATVNGIWSSGSVVLQTWGQGLTASWSPQSISAPTPLPARSIASQSHLSAQARTSAGQAPNPQFASHSQPLVLLPTVTPTPIFTEQPTATPTQEPTPTLPAYAPAAPFVELTGLRHRWQSWNNCGPTTLSMHLSYFGTILEPEAISPLLRATTDDPNVNPEELAAYARSQGYEARVLINGNRERLHLLLSNGLPVLVENWMEEEPNNGMGHYRLLTGYDEANRYWIAYDSYYYHNPRNPQGAYQGIHIPYADFDNWWKVFNRTYLVIYPIDRAPLVQQILGEDLEPQRMWQRALEEAQIAVTEQPGDAFAWFNLGSDLAALGRYAEAVTSYERARQLGLPWRMHWYQFGPFQSYYESGQYQQLVALADATLQTTGGVEELYYWRGRGLAALGDRDGARQAWQRALALSPRYIQASAALTELGP
jgi:tetratricopeptide (TPR) repeat protein